MQENLEKLLFLNVSLPDEEPPAPVQIVSPQKEVKPKP